jgi:uncharacterized protein (DUF849 family)
VLLQAALNGRRTKRDHRAVPLSPDELQADAIACSAAGAHSFHIHPRDEHGRERMDGAVVDRAAGALHDAVRWPVSVTTGDWIEPETRRRKSLVQRWHEPDATSVNVHEEAAFDVMRSIMGLGIGVEAGVWTVEDAEALVRSGLADRVQRILIEPRDTDASDALAVAAAIHAVLDRHRVLAPRLQHGEDASAWPLLEDAVRRDVATRIGLEDVLLLPDGSPAPDNPGLIAAARALGAGRGRHV